MYFRRFIDGAASARFGAWLLSWALGGAALVSCNGCSSTPEPDTPPPTATVAPVGSEGATDPATLPPPDGGECVKGGCSGELCQEPGGQAPAFTTCEYKREYDCYKTAICGRDADGQCNWQMTTELEKCLKVSR